MALLQIAEPGLAAAPHERKLGVGIDLGTTNSLVAAIQSGQASTLSDTQGAHLLPSVVQYQADKVLVGNEAVANGNDDPKNTIVSVKRFMGRSLKDVQQVWPNLPYDFVENSVSPVFVTSQGPVNPIQVSAEILHSLKDRAELTLGDEITGAVITVPAYFDDAQRQSTKDAAQLAGLNVLRLLNEPTAAAIAYGLDSQDEGVIAVYDLGGGTFDVSILQLSKGVFEVLATGGDSALGGDDFDISIVDNVATILNISNPQKTQYHRALMNEAKRVKEVLTEQDSATFEICIEQKLVEAQVTKKDFNTWILPFINRTIKACKRALKDAKLVLDDVDNVVLVGGSTRVSAVREHVNQFFKVNALSNINPDQVVAIGAAIQADILVGNKPDNDMLLLDVLPLSLGLETMGDLAEKVILRNTTIPVAKAQEFTTFKDGQTAMMIHVVQGERELVSDCRSLAKFTLTGIPPMTAGAAHIRVTFQVDADGLLNVTAMEKSTGVQAHIQVKPSYGLESDHIADMLKSSTKFAKQDMQARMLKEQQVEAKRVHEAMMSALLADGDALLSSVEKKSIEEALTELITAASQSDIDNIKHHIETVDQLSQTFAERRMDQSIKQALSGQSVNDI